MAAKTVNIQDNPLKCVLVIDQDNPLIISPGDRITFNPRGKTIILAVDHAAIFVRSSSAGDTLDDNGYERFIIDETRTLTVQKTAPHDTRFNFGVAPDTSDNRALSNAEIVSQWAGGNGEVSGMD